jgi:hypothetical protein
MEARAAANKLKLEALNAKKREESVQSKSTGANRQAESTSKSEQQSDSDSHTSSDSEEESENPTVHKTPAAPGPSTTQRRVLRIANPNSSGQPKRASCKHHHHYHKPKDGVSTPPKAGAQVCYCISRLCLSSLVTSPACNWLVRRRLRRACLSLPFQIPAKASTPMVLAVDTQSWSITYVQYRIDPDTQSAHGDGLTFIPGPHRLFGLGWQAAFLQRTPGKLRGA